MAKATAAQVAIYGHCAATIRSAMKRLGMTPSQLNTALGREPSNASVYHWINGTGAPSKEFRPKVAKLLGVSVEDLMKRTPGETAKAVAVIAPGEVLKPRPVEVLTFVVNDQGEGRLRLDVTLPVDRAVPLFRMLLDAGLIVARGEG